MEVIVRVFALIIALISVPVLVFLCLLPVLRGLSAVGSCHRDWFTQLALAFRMVHAGASPASHRGAGSPTRLSASSYADPRKKAGSFFLLEALLSFAHFLNGHHGESLGIAGSGFALSVPEALP